MTDLIVLSFFLKEHKQESRIRQSLTCACFTAVRASVRHTSPIHNFNKRGTGARLQPTTDQLEPSCPEMKRDARNLCSDKREF